MLSGVTRAAVTNFFTAMSLEQYLLKTPPPRRLRGALLNDSPTGATLQSIALFQLLCLLVAPLSYLLSEPTRKGLNDFLLVLDPPALWLGLWLGACVLLLFYARHLRGRFRLAEVGRAVQVPLVGLHSETYTVWVYYSVTRLERFTFSVQLPDGGIGTFTSDGHTPGTMRPTVARGDLVTALIHGDKMALLGLEKFDNKSALLVNPKPVTRTQAVLACAAVLLLVGLLLYSLQCCVLVDPFLADLKWLFLGGAAVGIAGLAWWRRRREPGMAAWLVLVGGALLGPLAVLALFGGLNCWLDFAPPEWREARVVSRRSKSLSVQLPVQIGELHLELDGQKFYYPCRPSRLYGYGQTVQVRVNRGLLGYRWVGAVR